MNLKRNRTNNMIFVALLLISVSSLHFFISVYEGFYHDIFDRLYYIPIIFSAFFFGLRGGTIAALLSGALFFLHLKMQWNMHTDIELLSKYLEIVVYIVVGVMTGIMSDLGKRQQAQTEEAYKRLNESFGKAKEAARLAAIGRISAGVAHEIRNPLGGIKGAVEVVSSEFGHDHPKLRFVKIIEKEIGRLDHIIGDFLNFARPRKPDLAPASLNNLLSTVLDLNIKNMEKKSISLTYNLDKDLPKVHIDPNQIKQVFLNVILNSIDSMPDGGNLEVISQRPEGALEIKISDTGSEIDQAKENQLFEPFFSTKTKGTGMGLAISKQIIEQHDGQISINNRIDRKGTMVTILLPVTKLISNF